MFPFPNLQCAGGGRIQTTTWNLADKNGAITLSGGNLTATGSGVGNQGVRGTTSKSAGKYLLCGTFAGIASGPRFGIANAAFGTSAAITTSDSISMSGAGGIFIGNTNISACAAAAAGDLIQMVFDFNAKLVWVRVNASTWNNNGAADPVAGTGGASWAAANAGPWFPLAFTGGSGSFSCTLDPYNTAIGPLPWDG